MLVRPALATEYDRYAPVMIQLTQEHARALPFLFYVPEDAPKRYWFDTYVDDPQKILLFCEEGNNLLGILLAEIQEVGSDPHTVLRPRKTLYIADMIVDESGRRKGVGKALFEHALAWGKQQGAVDSTLSVFAFNGGAQAFYQSLGYEALSVEMRKSLS